MILRLLLLLSIMVSSGSVMAGAVVGIPLPTVSSFHAPATFQVAATARATLDGESVTTFKLFRDGAQIGSGTTDISVNVSGLPAGSYVFSGTATTSFGATRSVSRTITVTAPASVPPTVQLGAITGTLIAPATLGLSATASDSDGSIAKVEFFAFSQLLGTDATAPYAINWMNVAAGTYSITAKAYDNTGAVTTSPAQSVTVTPSKVIGYIEGIGDVSGTPHLSGWACSTGLNASISVHMYAGGAAGTGTFVGSAVANRASESAVATACKAQGLAYRFLIPLTEEIRDAHAGKLIHVHGISPVGQPNDQLTQSGVFAVPAALTRVAAYVSQTVPASMILGTSYPVSVKMRNNGTATWRTSTGYKLGSYDPVNNTTWGFSRVALAGDVPPGATATFNFTVKAPTNPGSYYFQWRMLDEGTAWFGSATPSVAVAVTSVKPTVQLGVITGTPIAPATLGLSATAADSDGSITKVQFFANGQLIGTDSTAPYALNWANLSTGTYSFTAKAYDNAGDTATSAAKSVTVTTSNVIGHIGGIGDIDGTPHLSGWACSTGMTTSISVNMYAGGAVGAGTFIGTAVANRASESAIATECKTQGTAYRFLLPLTEDVRDVHAGKLLYVHGVSPIGQPDNLLAQSGLFAVPAALTRVAAYVSQSVPANMVAGTSYAVSVRMRNDGTATWRTSTGYKLGSQNPVSNTTWGFSRVPLAGDVPPGATATFNFTVKAPANPGSYNFQWRMVDEGDAWFGSPTQNVSVATFISIIAGKVENIVDVSGTPHVKGWACSTGLDQSVAVHMYLGGPAGATEIPGIAASANKASELGIATECKASGNTYRFLIPLSADVRKAHAGLGIYVHGISPVGQSNSLLGGSGILSVPAVPNGVPTVQLTAPTAGAKGAAPATVDLAADAADSDGVASVSFYANGGLLHVATTAPYSFRWSGVVAGTHSIQAVARDTLGATATSAAIAISVAQSALPPGSVTRHYVYNPAQQLCKTIEPETGATVSAYDGAGNLSWSAAGLALPDTTRCNAGPLSYDSGRRVDRTYDARNRIKSMTFADQQSDTTYDYTATGQLARITALNGGSEPVTTEYGYNRRGLPTSERLLLGSINWPVVYSYNANGHLAAQAWHGLNVTYAPNALGQPTQAGTYATGVSYFPNGAIRTFTYGNGVVHTMAQNARGLPERSLDLPFAGAGSFDDAYNYESGGRLDDSGLVTPSTSTAVLDDSYDYDRNGNVLAISDGLPGNRGDRDMTYDGLDRLTATTSPMFGTGAVYAYDVLDNLTQAKMGATPQAAARHHYFCYDASSRLTFVRSGPVCTGTASPALDALFYDVQGNVKSKDAQTFVFDHGNRLRSVNTPASAYLYDGHGRRVRDTTHANKYSQYTQSGALVFSVDLRAGTVSEFIQLGGSLVAIRERDTATNAYAVKYQHTDALGSPVAVTNYAGTELERSEYEPYGKVLNRPVKDGPGYTGHVEDAATGLTYMQQRYYDPGIGRFLSVDPIAADMSSAWNFNRYNYAANNPYKFTDPDGREIRFAPGTPASFMRNFAKATRYLNAKGAANGIGRAHASKEIVWVRAAQDRSDAAQSQYSSGKTKVVTWADTGGVEVTNSVTGEVGTMTPALVLGHEFEHVMNDFAGSLDRDFNTFDSQYSDQEHRNVIEEYERPAAERLGEPRRSEYSGKPVPVECPTKECS